MHGGVPFLGGQKEDSCQAVVVAQRQEGHKVEDGVGMRMGAQRQWEAVKEKDMTTRWQ